MVAAGGDGDKVAGRKRAQQEQRQNERQRVKLRKCK